jgi:hypothetical protein
MDHLNTLTEVDFRTWTIDNLARLTTELHNENKRLDKDNKQLLEANDQLRTDLKDAMNQLRKQTLSPT